MMNVEWGRLREPFDDGFFVRLNLHFQGFEAVQFFVRADKIDDLNGQFFAIKIAVKIEQIDLNALIISVL